MVKLTSKKTFQVVKYLLKNHETNQLRISKDTGVALGWTNKIINSLHDLNIVSKGSRQCKLEDPVRLLEAIANERPLKHLTTASFRLETTSIKEGEEILKEACQRNGARYALTVFSGLRRFHEYHIAYPSIHAYVANPNITNSIAHGQGPITLNLLQPDHSTILVDAKDIEGFLTCNPIQILIDLYCSGIGRDAAIKFWEVIQNKRSRNPR